MGVPAPLSLLFALLITVISQSLAQQDGSVNATVQTKVETVSGHFGGVKFEINKSVASSSVSSEGSSVRIASGAITSPGQAGASVQVDNAGAGQQGGTNNGGSAGPMSRKADNYDEGSAAQAETGSITGSVGDGVSRSQKTSASPSVSQGEVGSKAWPAGGNSRNPGEVSGGKSGLGFPWLGRGPGKFGLEHGGERTGGNSWSPKQFSGGKPGFPWHGFGFGKFDLDHRGNSRDSRQVSQ